MTGAKAARLVVGFGLAGVFLWLAFRHTDFSGFAGTIANADGRWVAVAVAALVAGYACRIERWRVMLARDNPTLSWRGCAGPLLGSFATNNVLPFRVGDVMRAFAFNDRLGSSSGTVIATLLVERLLDLLMVLLMLGFALTLLQVDATGPLRLGAGVLVLGPMGIMAVLLFPAWMQPLSVWAQRRAEQAASPLLAKVLRELVKVVQTLGHLAGRSTMARLLGWSVLAWGFEGVVFYGAALALPSVSQPVYAWLALPVGTLATLIPSTPGYAGTFDYFVAWAIVAFGELSAAATAYAIFVHAILWLPVTAAGGLYLLLKPAARARQV